ncbi:hypothetical protein NX059_012064 [Plenodomus lindquistii]|nr:hypothetical protein NX059_012064 [Plenodomus lindquistii]
MIDQVAKVTREVDALRKARAGAEAKYLTMIIPPDALSSQSLDTQAFYLEEYDPEDHDWVPGGRWDRRPEPVDHPVFPYTPKEVQEASRSRTPPNPDIVALPRTDIVSTANPHLDKETNPRPVRQPDGKVTFLSPEIPLPPSVFVHPAPPPPPPPPKIDANNVTIRPLDFRRTIGNSREKINPNTYDESNSRDLNLCKVTFETKGECPLRAECPHRHRWLTDEEIAHIRKRSRRLATGIWPAMRKGSVATKHYGLTKHDLRKDNLVD